MSAASCCYSIGRQLYVHVTSRCSTTPLLLTRGPGLQRPAWLAALQARPRGEAEPEVEALVAEVAAAAASGAFDSCTLAGLGEPTARLEGALAVAGAAVRARLPVRLNTNGLGSLEHGRGIAPELAAAGLSAVSVGLNAASEEDWEAVMAPERPGGFGAAVGFIRECRGAGLEVEVTCVETPGIDVKAVEALAQELGASFRARPYIFAPGGDSGEALAPGSLRAAAAEGDLRFDVGSAFEKDEVGNTVLVWAAERGHLHIVERLLRLPEGRRPERLDGAGHLGNTAVHRASRRGHEEVLRRLLRAGAAASLKNDKSQTALHFAAFYRHPGCVAALLEAGADTAALDRKGRRPEEDTKDDAIRAMLRAAVASSL